jgi:hypothetical protein
MAKNQTNRGFHMTLIESIREKIISEELPPIFSSSDLRKVGIDDPNNNLSNYDKKNLGSKNTKVLISTKIHDVAYYTFDEQLFD